jgi:hypothetical protein
MSPYNLAPSELILAVDNKPDATPLERCLADALEDALREINALQKELEEVEDVE